MGCEGEVSTEPSEFDACLRGLFEGLEVAKLAFFKALASHQEAYEVDLSNAIALFDGGELLFELGNDLTLESPNDAACEGVALMGGVKSCEKAEACLLDFDAAL